jgi:hypothetical protein
MTAVAAPTRERPILFSGPMVHAILKGRKTQTRRVVVVRKENGGGLPHDYPDNKIVVARIGDHAINETPTRLYGAEFRWSNGADLVIACPYGRPGDRLWVRESFAGPDHIGNGDQGVVGFGIEYKADGAFRAHGDCGCDGPCSGVLISHPWKPSIHMPRQFSRIMLEITAVRVEQLQTITEDDARAEGCEGHRASDGYDIDPTRDVDPVEEYRELWDSLNAKRGYGWDVNPWVWVLSFQRIA